MRGFANRELALLSVITVYLMKTLGMQKKSLWFFSHPWVNQSLIAAVLMLFSVVLPAKPQTPQLTATTLEPQIFQHCRFSGQRCLQHIDRFLLAATLESRYWFELMLLKLDSLFILQRNAELYALTSKLVLKDDLPAAFKARLYIYHAKVLYGRQQKASANEFLLQATDLLNQLHQAMPNPLTQLRLINVQIYGNGDYQAGFQQLLQLEKQLEKSRDAVLKYDLYNNMGHYTRFMQRTTESLHYRKLALQAIQQIDHPHKMAEAHYNLARTYSFLLQWTAAEIHFAAALWHYHSIDDSVMLNQSLMYLAEAMWLQQRKTAASALFQRVLPAKIPNSSQPFFARIAALLSTDD